MLNVTGSGAGISVTLEDEVLFTGNVPSRLEGEAVQRASNVYDIEFFEYNDSGITRQLMSLGSSTQVGGLSILDISGVNSTPLSIESFSASEWPTLNGTQFRTSNSQEIFQLGGSMLLTLVRDGIKF